MEKLLDEGLWKAKGNDVYSLTSLIKQSIKNVFEQI